MIALYIIMYSHFKMVFKYILYPWELTLFILYNLLKYLKYMICFQDALGNLQPQKREDLTASAQQFLRQIAFRQIHKVCFSTLLFYKI